MGTTSFSAGSLTLSGFVADFINQDGPSPGGAMLQPVTNAFDYNWGSATFNIVTSSADSPQIISGSGAGTAHLVLPLSTLDFVGAGDAAPRVWNGQTATDGQTIDFGTADATT